MDLHDGRIWDQIHWKDIHGPPLPRRELDGDFFRSKDIKGNVIVRHNFIAQAFNLLDVFAERAPLPGESTAGCGYRNTFTFIRDNAVEAENSATNWWVFENRIYNCHTWFAFEQCNGGYICCLLEPRVVRSETRSAGRLPLRWLGDQVEQGARRGGGRLPPREPGLRVQQLVVSAFHVSQEGQAETLPPFQQRHRLCSP